MVNTPGKRSQLPLKIVMLLMIFIMVGCVLVAGCSIPSIKNSGDGEEHQRVVFIIHYFCRCDA